MIFNGTCGFSKQVSHGEICIPNLVHGEQFMNGFSSEQSLEYGMKSLKCFQSMDEAGGLTIQIHTIVNVLGNSLGIMLIPGNVHHSVPPTTFVKGFWG